MNQLMQKKPPESFKSKIKIKAKNRVANNKQILDSSTIKKLFK